MLEHLTPTSGMPGNGLYLYTGFDDQPEFTAYDDFPAQVAAFAEAFRDDGIRPGTRVLFPFDTSVAVIMSFLALMEIGAVPLSVKPMIMSTPQRPYEDFLARVARDFAATRILHVPSLARVALPVPPLSVPAPGIRTPGARLRTPAGDDLAFVQFSSGSTAFPKGIPIRHDRLRANLMMIARTDRRLPHERISSWLPLYHDMGLIGGLLSCLFVGGDLLLAEPVTFLSDAAGWWEHMAREGVCGTVIPNFAIDYSLRMLQYAVPDRLAAMDLSGVRAIYLGSEPINIPNLHAFLDLMAPTRLRRDIVMPCYGMAEAVLLVSSCASGREARIVPSPAGVAAISLGAPMPEFTVRLRDADGNDCGERELGEIELTGGSLADAYLDKSEPLTGDDGFYRTGDIGFLDGGEIFVTGRISDRFKINGQSYFSSDFEQAVEHLAFVHAGRTAVIQSDGRVIVLTAVDRAARDDIQGSRATIVAHLVHTMGVTVEASDVHYLRAGQLPRTSSGKLQRRIIAERYEQGLLEGVTLPRR